MDETSEVIKRGHKQARRRREQRSLVFEDHLTGLYNRRYFDERLDNEFKETIRGMESKEVIKQAPMTLVLIDVDGFKEYNDEFGHPAGDKLLKDLAGIFTKGFRESDIIARTGGDEFGVIMPRTRATEAFVSVKRVMLAVEKSQFEKEEGISLSIGLSDVHPPIMSTSQDLYKITDKFLYKAKKAGGNAVWHPLRDRAEG
jgi:diguanylate cyclase (GGDEF)-like protein